MKSMKAFGALGAATIGLSVQPLSAQDWEWMGDLPTTNHVVGTVTLGSRFLAGYDQRLYKTGDGAWTLPWNLLDTYWPFTVKTTDGSLAVGVGADAGTDPGALTLPTSITDKALLWVDATDPQASHLAGSGDEVSIWYDRREGASVASPQYYYAKADSDVSTGGNPVKATFEGRAGVYFGGVGSFKCMPWYKKDGTRCTSTPAKIYHFFVVTGVSNSWGCVYGSWNGNTSTWATDVNTCSDLDKNTTTYMWDKDYGSVVSHRSFLNGERLEPLAPVQRGVQLVDLSPDETRHFVGGAHCFFNDRNIKGRGYGLAKDYIGGDFIHEAICFKSQLTEAEIRQVRAYLMRKWQIAGCKDVRVALSSNSELTADTTSGIATNGANVVGGGTLAKKGANDLVYRNFGGLSQDGEKKGALSQKGGTRFDGDIDIREGAVAMQSQAAVAVAAGTRLASAAALGDQLPRVTTASADSANAFVKDGAGDAYVNGLPEGVKTLDVTAGFLGIRNVKSAPALAGDTFEVYVPNNSFEEDPGNLFGDGATNCLTTGRCHWYASNAGNVMLIRFDKWTGNSLVMDNNNRQNWNFFSDAPDGYGVMSIDNGAYAETDVTIPSAGWYEVSLKYSAREGYGRNNVFNVLLVGGETVDFGRALDYYSGAGEKLTGSYWSFSNPAGYQPAILRAYVATPGAYRLRISRKPGLANNVRMTFDDIHLRRVAEAMPETVAIPGGTFETVSLWTSTANFWDLYMFTNTMQTVAGWTFAEPAGYPDQYGSAAGIATPRTQGYYRNAGEFYNDTRGPGHGFAEALFRAPTTATTTFTATKSGTFRVQADLACFYTKGGKMQLTATVNGTAHDLGTLAPDHKLMRTRQWPVRLALEAGDSVTLTFTFTRTGDNAGLWMDDVCLATKCIPVEGNLVKNGSFEKYVPYTIDNWTHAGVNWRDYETTDSAQIKAFGQEKLDGRYYVCVQRRANNRSLSYLYQNVTFPQEGVYRLSFYTHKRLNSGSSAGNTAPTVWWLANTSANTTNWLIRTANDTNRYTEHTVDFYVPSAGTFRLGCTGDPVGSGSDWYDAMLDNVSVVHLGDLQPTDDFDKKLQIEVAAGARLNVCFEGTNRIDSLRLGGKHVHGIIDAKSHPDYISGAGAFAVRPRGLVIVLN